MSMADPEEPEFPPEFSHDQWHFPEILPEFLSSK
jgi:hypothetical protein